MHTFASVLFPSKITGRLLVTVFSIPVFRIGESLIPGSRRDYNDSGISDSSVLNPGIKKMGTGLQDLHYRSAIMPTSRIRKVSYFDCIFANDYWNAIDSIPEQETQLLLTYRATHLCKYNCAADLKNALPERYYQLPCRFWSFCVKG